MASRKDYVAIASAIKQAATDTVPLTDHETLMVMHVTLSEYVARALNAENSSFDKDRFLSACGYKRDARGYLVWAENRCPICGGDLIGKPRACIEHGSVN